MVYAGFAHLGGKNKISQVLPQESQKDSHQANLLIYMDLARWTPCRLLAKWYLLVSGQCLVTVVTVLAAE